MLCDRYMQFFWRMILTIQILASGDIHNCYTMKWYDKSLKFMNFTHTQSCSAVIFGTISSLALIAGFARAREGKKERRKKKLRRRRHKHKTHNYIHKF